MNQDKIAGIFFRLDNQNPSKSKLVIWYQMDRFRDRYEVRRLSRNWNEIDIVRDLIRLLDAHYPKFLERFAMVDEKNLKNTPHRIRRYFSKTQLELYPRHDQEFAKKYSDNYKDYWVATNIGCPEIKTIIREMCEACEIKFGSIAQLEL